MFATSVRVQLTASMRSSARVSGAREVHVVRQISFLCVVSFCEAMFCKSVSHVNYPGSQCSVTWSSSGKTKVTKMQSFSSLGPIAYICSANSRNLRHLEIALHILRILKLRANLEIAHWVYTISRLRSTSVQSRDRAAPVRNLEIAQFLLHAQLNPSSFHRI